MNHRIERCPAERSNFRPFFPALFMSKSKFSTQECRLRPLSLVPKQSLKKPRGRLFAIGGLPLPALEPRMWELPVLERDLDSVHLDVAGPAGGPIYLLQGSPRSCSIHLSHTAFISRLLQCQLCSSQCQQPQ